MVNDREERLEQILAEFKDGGDAAADTVIPRHRRRRMMQLGSRMSLMRPRRKARRR